METPLAVLVYQLLPYTTVRCCEDLIYVANKGLASHEDCRLRTTDWD